MSSPTLTMPRVDDARPLRRLQAGVIAAVAGGLLIGGCGDDPHAHNSSDIDYASHLISHHAQTLQLLDVSVGRGEVSDEAGALADQIRTERWDEVARAREWLKDWGEPVPKTALEHTHGDGPTEYDTSIRGVLTRAEMLRLQQRRPRAFQGAWLKALVEHEDGAAELAADAARSAANAELAAFAREDAATHRQQADRLRALLRGS